MNGKMKIWTLAAGLLILGGGAFYFFSQRAFDLRIQFRDLQGNNLTELAEPGLLKFQTEQGLISGKPDGQGGLLFRQFPGSLKGKPVAYEWNSSRWVPNSPSRKILIKENTFALQLKNNPKMSFILGQIRDDSHPLAGVTVGCCKGISTYTDEDGNFALRIPEDKQAIRQLLTANLDGYEYYQRFIDVTEELPVILLIAK